MATKNAGRYVPPKTSAVSNPSKTGMTAGTEPYTSSSKIVPQVNAAKTSVATAPYQPGVSASNVGTPLGGPGSTGGSGGFNMGGSGTAKTPFGQAIPGNSYGEAYANPDILVREFFRQKGMGTHSGAYAQAQQHSDAIPLLWMLMQDKQTAEGTGNLLDWTGQYLENQMTPGGPVLGPGDIARAILAVRNDPNSNLKNYLDNTGLSPSDQVGNILSTLNKGFQATAMPDIVRAAMMARLRELGDNFQDTRLRNPGTNSFLDESAKYLNSMYGNG